MPQWPTPVDVRGGGREALSDDWSYQEYADRESHLRRRRACELVKRATLQSANNERIDEQWLKDVDEQAKVGMVGVVSGR